MRSDGPWAMGFSSKIYLSEYMGRWAPLLLAQQETIYYPNIFYQSHLNKKGERLTVFSTTKPILIKPNLQKRKREKRAMALLQSLCNPHCEVPLLLISARALEKHPTTAFRSGNWIKFGYILILRLTVFWRRKNLVKSFLFVCSC